jgi:hypothetical protein
VIAWGRYIRGGKSLHVAVAVHFIDHDHDHDHVAVVVVVVVVVVAPTSPRDPLPS